ncbi:MAG: radical SAM protein, partial [Bacteroidales bacterium]|nr:radical SAM protein [Bacteroidales bacterium]
MTNPRGKINLITLGCSKNLVDSERLLNQFSLNGFEAIHDSSDASADIVIINTCGFIDAAKEESIDTILQYAAARKRGTLKKLLVMGCLSERYSRELAQEIPEVDKFYGKFDFRSIIADLNASFFEHKFYSRLQTTPSHFAYLKISEGCNRTCSFCAIPQFTGKYRSRQPESLIDEAHALADTGVKELLLIAQDLTYYGIDLCGKSRLADLLCRLADVDGIDRIRLHYTFPAGFPLDVLDVIN